MVCRAVSCVLRLRRCGFDSRWGCAGAACRGPALRKGLDRAVGCDGGSGSRAVARGGRKNLRFCPLSGGSATESSSAVDLPPSEGCTGGESTAERVRGGSASPFSWHGPREGRSAAHPTSKCTHDSSFVRLRSDASAWVTGSRGKRSILGVPTHERRSLRPTRATARVPNPTLLPAARSRPFRRPHPAPAEAAHQRSRPAEVAHQQGRDTRGSAPASPDPHTQHPLTRRSPRRRGPVGASIVCARGERQVTRWGACRGWRPSCDARGACGRSYP